MVEKVWLLVRCLPMRIISRIKSAFARPADFIIGGANNPYMFRWYIIPRNRFFNVYLHKIVRDDDDRALHDHPWASLSLVLSGRYCEITHSHSPAGGERAERRRVYGRGSIIYRSATYSHRLEVINQQPCWTLFLTGRKVREWGFFCRAGWKPWHEFVDAKDSGAVGAGCGEDQ